MIVLLLAACSQLSAPTIQVHPSAQTPLSRLWPLPVTLSHDDGIAKAELIINETTLPVQLGGPTPSVPLPDLPDGPQRATLVVYADTLMGRQATAELTLHVDQTPPALVATLLAKPAKQGETLALRVTANEPLPTPPSMRWADVSEPMFPVSNHYVGFAPIAIDAPVGQTMVMLAAVDEAGNQTSQAVAINIADVDYPVGGYIKLNEAQTAARADKAALAKMKALRDQGFAERTAGQFLGAFVKPAKGRASSPFGKLRDYSDGAKQFHTGIDMAAPLGTPVHATAAGRVTLAQSLPIYGNVIILDHGMAVASSYNHLEAFKVRVGDQVKAGEMIGLMGTTGQSTGSHLHFTVTVRGEDVSPQQWLETDFHALMQQP